MRGKKRPPEERVSNVAGPLPPCKICGEPAAGFHYGVNTCEACKGFFRRSLLRNGEYSCIGQGNCVIGSNRRKSCPKCRYLKCLKVGMSKEAIKTGRYTYMKRTHDILEIKQLSAQMSSSCQSLSNSSVSEGSIQDSLSQLDCLDYFHHNDANNNSSPGAASTHDVRLTPCTPKTEHTTLATNCAENKSPDTDSQLFISIIKERLQERAPGETGDQSSELVMTDLIMSNEPKTNWLVYKEFELDELIIKVVKSHKEIIVDLNCVPEEDIEQRTKECKERCLLQTEIFGHLGSVDIDEHEHIYNTTGIDVDGRIDELSYGTTKMDNDIRDLITFMKRIPGFKDLTISDQIELVKGCIYELSFLGYYKGYNYKELIVVEHYRSYCYHQMTCVYTNELLDNLFRLTHQLQLLDLNFETIIILKVVCLFFPDRVNLNRYDQIERMHHKVVQALLLLLQRQYGSRHLQVFAKIISLLTSLRSLVLDCRKLWDQLKLHRYKEVADKPILTEIFRGGSL